MNSGGLYGLDLFSGIGGLTKALDGYVRPVAYCDVEPYARAVLLSRMATGDIPAAPIWDDVTTLRGSVLPRIDIIYGGFPCQDISVAGKQVGLGGERSGLFFEIMRLARETKAEWLFLENVSNIRTKGLGSVLKELDASGFDCRWGLLSAADVGANHKRERWFLLAHSRSVECSAGTKEQRAIREVPGNRPINDNAGGPSAPLADADDAGQRISVPDEPSQNSGSGTFERPCDVADTASKQGGRVFVTGLHKDIGATGDGGRQASWWAIEPNVGRVAHGVPHRVDRLRALGNAVVPAQAREAFERLMGLR